MAVPVSPPRLYPPGLSLSLRRGPGHANEVAYPQRQPCVSGEPQREDMLLQSCHQISRAKGPEPEVTVD